MRTTELGPLHAAPPDIGTYARSTRRRLRWWMVALPVVAATAAAVYLLGQPVIYESSLQFIVPDELGAGSSSVGLYLADLEQRLIDPDVIGVVVEATGVDADDYVSNIRVGRIGQSSSAAFTFTHQTPDEAEQVLTVAAETSLASLAEDGLPFAKREMRRAEDVYTDAVSALEQFRREHNVAFPDEEYRQGLVELHDVQAELEDARAVGDDDAVADLTAETDDLTVELDQIEQVMPEFEQLDDARLVALDSRSRARDRLSNKRTEIRLIRESIVTRDIATRARSRKMRALQGAATATAVTVFLQLLALVLPDLLRSRDDADAPADARRL